MIATTVSVQMTPMSHHLCFAADCIDTNHQLCNCDNILSKINPDLKWM